MADEASIEDQVARALDAAFGPAELELVAEVQSRPVPELLEVPELLRTHALYGGA